MTMKLIIAEKPSLARAIADALPGKSSKQKGYIEVGDTTVSWCIGHLLEQAPPDHYDDSFKRWSRDTLPIVPNPWAYVPKPSARGQLSILRGLLKKAALVIHAGDPDREGQLLVDEVLHHLRWKGPTQRLLIADMNLKAVRRSLAKLEDNKDYAPLSTSALARARADWLYGMNLTRAWTLIGRKQGLQSVLSIGRVQTPILGLIVKRDNEIKEFESHEYFDLTARITDRLNDHVEAQWIHHQHSKLSVDIHGHAIDKLQVDKFVNEAAAQPVQLLKNDSQKQAKSPPLPFNLSRLQVYAGSRFKLSAKAVLDACQSLYEKHRLLTYPRSDCQYLPVDQHQQAPDTLAAIQRSLGAREWFAKLDTSIKSKAFNDKKISAHHAIIPTEKPANFDLLTPTERNIYTVVAEHYAAQFLGAYEYTDNIQLFNCLDEHFQAKARAVHNIGWRAALPAKDDVTTTLANWQLDTPLWVNRIMSDAKRTRPPNHYTDATLIQAMSNIARFVEDKALAKVLRDTDGIGTEATRASMIETLEKRGYIIRSQRLLLPTELGHCLIKSLPQRAVAADLTAQWERQLDDIVNEKGGYQAFMDTLLRGVNDLLIDSDHRNLLDLPAKYQAPKCPKCDNSLRRGKSKRGWFWSCTNKACDYTATDRNGMPGGPRRSAAKSTAKKTQVKCADCDGFMMLRKSKRGEFLGCENYPKCKSTQKLTPATKISS